MALRLYTPWNDPRNQFEYHFEFQGNEIQKELFARRKEMGKKDYSDNICMILLLRSNYIELGKHELASFYETQNKITNFQKASENVCSKMQVYYEKSFDINKNNAIFQSKYISKEWLIETTNEATAGDNNKVEELEFAFACYSTRSDILLYWAALGLIGKSKQLAFNDLTCLSYSDNKQNVSSDKLFDDIDIVISAFDEACTARMGGGPAGPAAYKKLPPLW